MKSLAELGLENHKTGNYANYLWNNKDVVCCGWMEPHEDSDSLGDAKNPIFRVKPLFWADNAVFAYQPKKKWHILSKSDFLKKKKVPGIKYKNDSFFFDATKYHCLVPLKVAQQLNDERYIKSKKYYKFLSNVDNKATLPKLVWEWAKE